MECVHYNGMVMVSVLEVRRERLVEISINGNIECLMVEKTYKLYHGEEEFLLIKDC